MENLFFDVTNRFNSKLTSEVWLIWLTDKPDLKLIQFSNIYMRRFLLKFPLVWIYCSCFHHSCAIFARICNNRFAIVIGFRRNHTAYWKNNNLKKWAGMGLNGFDIKWIIGTHCNRKNQNPGRRMFILFEIHWDLRPMPAHF